MGLNSEQKEASEHDGGVLLKAGAGSGKTFVLVEHIYFLLLKFIEKNENADKFQFEKSLRNYLSSIVLMTFTKKAAGELAIRLRERIEKEKKEDIYREQWEMVGSFLNYLFVGTIHGFCLQLIREGHFKDVSSDIRIVSNDELLAFLDDSLKSFFIKYPLDDTPLKIMRMNKRDLLQLMHKIFLDSSLKIAWNKFREDDINRFSFSHDLKLILEKKGFSKIFSLSNDKIENRVEKKAAADYLKRASSILSCPKSLDDLRAHFDFFQSYKRLPSRPKDIKEDLFEIFEVLKKYKDFLNKNIEFFEAYEKNKNDMIPQWFYWIQKVFTHLSDAYEKFDGVTFADFEYLTLRGISKMSIKDRIRGKYRYIIIDEFQDTSRIQFDIIKAVIGDDFNRVFTVGDVKQAIYHFRGGDISVFQECEKKMPRTLELKNNYRSHPSIIKFNNVFFKSFLPNILFQTPPQDIKYNLNGKIEMRTRKIKISEGEKLSSKEINFLESKEIIDILNEQDDLMETTCVLYKKLNPSLMLLAQMIEQGISFSFQAKIEKDEAPILILFYHLSKGYLSKRETQSTLFIMNSIFRHLSLESHLDRKNLEKFYDLLDELGPYHAYVKFLFEYNLSTSITEHNLIFIKNILEVCGNDIERFYLFFENVGKDKFSFEFQIGDCPQKIQIMSVHSAKGLEFDRVILAGIHTNGRERVDYPLFGKKPGSFRWKLREDQKDFYKSPLLILEECEEKEYSTMEDKRLLYVATTRAKKELLLIDFSLPEKSFTSPSMSWIHLFKEFLFDEESSLIERKILEGERERPPLMDNERPFFHKNPIGVFPSKGKGGKLFLLGDLSVTAISTSAQCPRKFYLSHILKISFQDIKNALSEEKGDAEKKPQEFLPPLSNRERGTRLHADISRMIQDSSYRVESFSRPLEWVQKQLLPYSKNKLLSEQTLKFPLFGTIVSGTPDLMIERDRATIIWDFKSGRKRDNDEHYWLQLKLYAFALWELKKVDKNDPIEIALLYLDEEKKEIDWVEYLSIKEEIFSFWKNLNSIDKTNPLHCSQCDYGKLCRL
ncbi:MAG: UvrD-helicase domain-containing protein [Bacteriovoracales bacterium]|nr:UvrD-helicase domain-containing protein [Bacteriovoracales bacterium]